MSNIVEYLTHDNGGRPLKVSIYKDKKEANIFTFNKDDFNDFLKFPKKKDYITLIYKFYFEKVFIGRSLKIPMTEFSGGYGKKFTGNTILFQIKPKHYIFVGNNIFSFTTNDNIISYFSHVGNNDVPYPYAIGEENVYFLSQHRYIKREDFPIEIKDNTNDDLYNYLYFEKLPNHKMNVKVLEKRIL